ncbi:MAG: CCA-adding enzyme [Parcubacteria group bacterium ADurb.Bin247]|nr:MAG: CCA-adding enzyme [Parcubacteria group bacterium ADurb.Bin247]
MNIPKEIVNVIKIINDSGFEAYIVGGCVRDSLMKKTPEDWDLATNATPEKIQQIFKKNGFDSFYENNFGTVGVLLSKKERTYSDVVEITTYRTEGVYRDKRRPENVKWAKTIEEDLSRRDFTVNAIAVKIEKGKNIFIDPFDGKKDLDKKIIRAVGDPTQRFEEDALRIFRAIRFAGTLGFEIEKETLKSIKKNGAWILDISSERIRDEFIKMIMSKNAYEGINLLNSTGILKHILPEIVAGCGVSQNKHHIYDCYEHNLLALKYAAKKNFNFHVRMAALLHDVAKPKCKRGEGPDATFYNHEIVGAKMTKNILERLKFSKKDIDKITLLVRYHLFYYNVGEVSESSIRRLVRQVGIENMDDLLNLRMCDRIGSGVPKAEPYKLRHLKYIIEKTSKDPISVKKLKIKGQDVIDILKIEPGPKVGWILNILLGQILQDPKRNNTRYLKKQIKELSKLSDKDLLEMDKKAKKDILKIETKSDEMTKKKYWIT